MKRITLNGFWITGDTQEQMKDFAKRLHLPKGEVDAVEKAWDYMSKEAVSCCSVRYDHGEYKISYP